MKHISEYGLSYGTVEEYNFRKNIFMEAHKFIEEHNSKNNTWTVGHNFMSTMTHGEKKRMTGYVASPVPASFESFTESNSSGVNWVTKGGVTPVKNQGSCGSCWSFSTTGAMEGAHFNASKKLVSFSEQQLVDCSKRNHGCNGGSMQLAFMFLEQNAAVLESNYAYTGRQGTCKTKTATNVNAKSYSNVS